MKSPLMAAAWAIACTIATAASAGTIHGTLHVPATHAPAMESANPYPGHAHSLPGMHMVERGLVTDAVVYVERIPAAAESALAAAAAPPPKLAQKDQMFAPRVVAIAVGSAVDFPNMDPIYHNVFSASPVRRFDLGKYPKGNSRRVEFRKTGLVNVYCDIHSNMEAFILVTPNHAFARPSAAGEFALPDLPPGSYQLRVWHPDLGEQKLAIEVPASGDAVATLSY
jgi:plastocyanin